jgi:hypothetical protein
MSGGGLSNLSTARLSAVMSSGRVTAQEKVMEP